MSDSGDWEPPAEPPSASFDPFDPLVPPQLPYVQQLDPRARRAEQQRRATLILSAVASVVLVAAGLAAVALSHSNSSTTKTTAAVPAGQAASPAVLAALTGVPASVVTAVGSGSSTLGITSISGGGPASGGGPPSVLFVGGEFCPYCAAERWSIIQAFSRFGTFSGIAQIRSSEGDLPTFDFAGSRYRSKYVGLAAVEIVGENHQRLQTLTASQQAIFAKYSQDESFPFLYFDGRYVQDGAGFDPTVLSGLDQQQVAAQLGNSSSVQTRSIVGEANVLTAAICDIDGDAPSSVCGNPAVSALQAKISGAIPS